MRQGPCVLIKCTVVNVWFYLPYLRKALETLSSYIAVNIWFLNFCSQDQTHGLVKTALAKTKKTFAMLVVKRNSLCTFISLFLVSEDGWWLNVLPLQSCAICTPLHKLL